jgi:hypothetical protein
MADPRYPRADQDARAGRDEEHRTPRWVSPAVVGVVVVVVLVMVVLHLTGAVGPAVHR